MDDDHSNSSASRDGISFHSVSGGAVLFNAANGRLYALNPVAGLTWLCLRDGLSPAESALALANGFRIEHAVAAEWFRTSAQLFQDLGFLGSADHIEAGGREYTSEMAAAPRSRSSQPEGGVEYRLFEQCFRINAPRDLQSVIDSLLGPLRTDSPRHPQDAGSRLQIDIVADGEAKDETWDIALNGQVESRCETASVVAEIERLLLQAVVPMTPHLLTLHAAALQRDGRTLLLAGPSGAGKTTLSLALAKAGWRLGSDEIVLLGHTLDLRPLPLPPCIKSDTFPVVERWFSELRSTPAHSRYGRTVKFLPVKSSPFVSAPVQVVFPRYDRHNAGHMQRMDTFSGLERLLAQCVFVPTGFRHDDVAQLLRWHDGLHYFDLTYDDCDTAVSLLTSIALFELPQLP